MLAREIDLTAGTELSVEIHEVEMVRELRTTRPNKIIIDWSRGEQSADDYGKGLGESKKGCHLYIDKNGDVHQFADLWLHKVKRGGIFIDQDAIWIVMQNRGDADIESKVKRGGFLYPWGKKRYHVFGANNDQIDALLEVVMLIGMSIGIPLGFPHRDENMLKEQLSPLMTTAFSGVLLASHVLDTAAPGPGILDALQEAFEDLEEDENEDEDEDEDEDEPGQEDEIEFSFDTSQFERDFPDPS